MTYQDRTYHGIGQTNEHREARILVEEPASGPTERQHAEVLGALQPERDGLQFNWGYNGNGPSYAAVAILTDALDLGDPNAAGIAVFADRRNEVLNRLRVDFCGDVVSQLCHEWRLRRGAVLRWARGWYTQHGITDLPAALQELPARHSG